jgi:hypothetical protein
MSSIVNVVLISALSCIFLGLPANSQPVQAINTPQVNVTTGLVWFLLVFIFTLSYGLPIMCWLYRVIIAKLVEKASKKIETWSMRLSERFSAAGRKLSEQMRA